MIWFCLVLAECWLFKVVDIWAIKSACLWMPWMFFTKSLIVASHCC